MMHGIGVLLINLGTPDSAEPKAVRKYLAEFLSDRRVVEIPQIAWQPLLRGVILRTRPRKSAEAYSKVWTEDGSPLRAITKRKAAALRARLGDEIMILDAMRYGQPSIADGLGEMLAHDCDRILLAPLYPQYCAATTATANDKAFEILSGMRWQPAIRTLPPYYDDPAYIGALKANIERQLAALDFEPEKLLLSFHGMPERTRKLGDPYYDHCQTTARLLAAKLSLPVDVTFQSRFGRAKWLEPATDETIEAYPRKGVKRIAVAAPGFSADCLETLEELGIRGRESFLSSGGEKFALLECLNDSPEGMGLLETLIRRELAGWHEGA
ncbi:ferrochelatase [Sphingomonas alba]|uniref:Ferrochelatase n=1 Tax=Sphingomonas alba TaxID=2908208 RepID=A0ABT0RM26_9SPHN|nr:ferrochelatase [Sphingomonas alba]MCL6683580.1 ferrochelatase [Sphingomonas alba]